jgi:hypothetical protein
MGEALLRSHVQAQFNHQVTKSTKFILSAPQIECLNVPDRSGPEAFEALRSSGIAALQRLQLEDRAGPNFGHQQSELSSWVHRWHPMARSPQDNVLEMKLCTAGETRPLNFLIYEVRMFVVRN